MIAKRLFDLICVVPGLLVLFPFAIVVAIWIKWGSKGPIFFRQVRVGKNEIPFQIFKFRTMVMDAEQKGEQITIGLDPRITKSGRLLRKYKLDELPQLINILIGDMSLVGPRPEVPKYVAHYPEHVRRVVLSVLPGITDHASIEFRNENDLLAELDDPEKHYIKNILPRKLDYYQKYVAEQSLWTDFLLILKTCKIGVMKCEHATRKKPWFTFTKKEFEGPPFVFGIKEWQSAPRPEYLYYRSAHKENGVNGVPLCELDLHWTDENIICPTIRNALKKLLEMDEYSNITAEKMLDGYVMENMKEHTKIMFSKEVESVLKDGQFLDR